MGMLIDGHWQDDDKLPTDEKGAFVRPESPFRSWVTPDGKAGPTGEAGFEAEPGRYHLFVAYGCPWAHRAIIVRRLKGLEDVVTMSASTPMRDQGWSFTDGVEGQLEPGGDGVLWLHEVYTAAKPDITCRVTVPTVWDRKRKTIVNNESSEIIRMLNSAFNAHAGNPDLDLLPESRRADIDTVNAAVYENFNNGVYRAGFARSQEAYESAARDVFETLDMLEARLEKSRFLVGDTMTEADIRLFPTLIRFDVAYYGAFKCNLRRIEDYPNLSNYLRDLYQTPGIKETVRLNDYKRGYYAIRAINPTGIYPIGPEIDLDRPHDRTTRSYGAAAAE